MRRMYSENQLLKTIEKESQENGLQVFETIVDKDGHPRFIEGNISIGTMSGITKQYGKWSLSGSHLLMVLALKCENGSVIPSGYMCDLEVPQWIQDKIIPLYSTTISSGTSYAYATGGSSQQVYHSLIKISETRIRLYVNTLTLTAERFLRIQYDLLIDNE